MVIFSHCEIPIGWGSLRNGCQSAFYEEECLFEAYCANRLDFRYNQMYSYQYEQCAGKRTVSLSGAHYVPVRLHLKVYDEAISQYNYYNNANFYILYLDLSYNLYFKIPTIRTMENLVLLNISHNDITTVKFSNKYELKSLEEIDLSFNKISKIDNDENDIYVYRKLKKLNLSYNQLSNLPDAIFNNIVELEYLDLSHNFITNITLTTFEGIKKLKVLYLSHNNIEDINSSLFRFNKLTELYVNNNKIKNILARDFEKLIELEVLDLSNNLIITMDENVFSNLIVLKQIDLSGNLLTAIDKDTFSMTANLQSIDLSENKLTELPLRLFQAKNISFFSVEQNNLEGSLRKDTFEGLQLITKLDMSYQSIKSIEDFAFFGLDNLTELLLNNNNIESLSNKSFQSLRNLVHLDLSNNRITIIDFNKEDLINLRSLLFHNNYIAVIKSENLRHLHLLEFLDLSKNNISKIESRSFEILGNVNNLLINQNPLSGNLEENTFKDLTMVPKLDLSNTGLNVIMNASFNGMTNLYYLNISHSKVSELQYNTFANTGNIEILDFSYNEIENFEVNTTNLKNIKQLLLNNNHIKFLNNNIFKSMSLLNNISLSNNLITSVEDGAFQDQKNLRYLDLSCNSNIRINFLILKEIKALDILILSRVVPNITFEGFGNISLSNLDISNSNIQNVSNLKLSKLKTVKFLHLNHNNVKQLEIGAFSNMFETEEIDVSYNQIKTIQPGIFKNNHLLNKLNISHNALLVLNYGVFRGLINLVVFDTSFNFIKSLETERFYDVPNLQVLIADHNRITDVSIDDFQGTNINKISIGDNPLPCEVLMKLKKASTTLAITALRHVVDNEENIDGISCNNNFHEFDFKIISNEKQHTGNYNESVLNEIKDILLSLGSELVRSGESTVKNENLLSLNNLLQQSRVDYINKLSQLSNVTLELNEKQETITKLLERILKVMVAMNSLNSSIIPVRSNVTSDNFMYYLNKIRQDFDNAMILDKEKILAEMENKISLMMKHIQSETHTTSSLPILSNQKLPLNYEPKSYVLLETCVVFILIILVCLVLYKIYKTRFYIRHRRYLSTNPTSDMDTSNV